MITTYIRLTEMDDLKFYEMELMKIKGEKKGAKKIVATYMLLFSKNLKVSVFIKKIK